MIFADPFSPLQRKGRQGRVQRLYHKWLQDQRHFHRSYICQQLGR